tara:strand:- start:5272 stop:6105 length:834 start_codon:yes stop_codon:yes gene_type:complete
MAKTETKEMEFYGGAIKVAFYPNSHRYKLIEEDGEERKEWIPSPSTIINKLDKSRQLIPWAVGCFETRVLELMRDGRQFTRDDVLSMLAEGKNAHNEIKEKACNVGTIVHEFAEDYSADPKTAELSSDYELLTDEDKAKVDNGINAFKEWVKEHDPKFLKSEFSVFSRKERFVGTSDELVEFDNDQYKGKYLLDYKTSKGVYSSHFYQASSYLKAYEEEYSEKLDGAMIVHFSKDTGEFGVVVLSRSDLVQGYVGFKALQTIYSVDKDITKKLYERK